MEIVVCCGCKIRSVLSLANGDRLFQLHKSGSNREIHFIGSDVRAYSKFKNTYLLRQIEC